MSRKRVLQVVHSLPIAGTESLVVQIVQALKKDFEMGVCCLDDRGPLAEQLEAENIPVFVLRREPGRDWNAAKRLRRLVESFSPDMIHAHQYTPFFYASLAKTRKTKLLFTEHGRHYPDVVGIKRKLFNQWAQFRADYIGAVCDFSRQRLRRKEGIWGREIELIYNGVPVKNLLYTRSEELRLRYGILKSAKVIGFVGRLHSIKNPKLLVRAFKEIASKHKKAHLLFVGDGELREKLEKQVKKQKLVHRVTFAGAQFPVYSFYKAMDLLVLPSRSEGASVTLLEAMAAKVPVIASDVGGNAEFIENKVTGRLFPNENKRTLVKLLNQFFQKPEKYSTYAKNGYKLVKEHYNQEKMFKEYKKLYESLS